MEIEAPTLDMKYPPVATTTTAQLAETYKEITQERIVIGRGGNSVEARRLQAGAAIKTQLLADMNVIEGSFVKHQKNIKLLGDSAKEIITRAKAAVLDAQSSGSELALAKAAKTTLSASHELHQIAEQAKEADKAFGQSWFEYRTLSLPDVPDTFKEEFLESRMKIMGDGKLVRAKVDKLAQLETQATAFAKMSQQLMNKGTREKAQAIEEAKALAAQMKTLLEKIENAKNIGWLAVQNKIKNITTAAKAPAIQKQLLANLKSVETDLTSALKTYKTTVKTMETVWTSGLRTLSVEDKKIKEVALALKAGEADHGKAKEILAEAQVAITKAVKDMATIKTKPVK